MMIETKYSAADWDQPVELQPAQRIVIQVGARRYTFHADVDTNGQTFLDVSVNEGTLKIEPRASNSVWLR